MSCNRRTISASGTRCVAGTERGATFHHGNARRAGGTVTDYNASFALFALKAAA
jgi:hypothetical protein